jgi:nitrogen fixation protein NifU and related proteins
MRADPKALYQEVILDHNRKPRNFGVLEQASHRAEGHNPLCGDHLSVALGVEGEAIARIAFEGESCAICKASASMMTVAVKGKALPQARSLIQEFLAMSTGKIEPDEAHQIGHLAVFSGVRDLPTRVKCAVLPWHTLQAAIDSQPRVCTEADADPSTRRTDTP